MVVSKTDHYQNGLQQAAAGNYAAAIASYEQALRINPDDIHTLYGLAVAARALGIGKVAEKFLITVLNKSPGQLEAIVSLANLYRAQGRFPDARRILTQALQETPNAPELLLTMGSVARESAQSLADEAEAETLFRTALKYRPDYLPALGNLADMIALQGRTDETFALYEQLLPHTENNPQISLNYAILLLSCGRLEEGWKYYTGRLGMSSKVPAPDHNLPRWDGVFRNGLRLLITAEQGIGDQIMFASILPDLLTRANNIGMHIILECEPRLLPLFTRSYPTAHTFGWHVQTQNGKTTSHYPWLGQAGGADVFCEFGSLAGFLRQTLADFPNRREFLTPDTKEVEYWQKTLAALPRPLVGVSWRSGKLGGTRSAQYAPQADWARFIQALPGTPVMAQYGATDEEIGELELAANRKIYVPQGLDQKQELDRTVAFLSTLDVVVSAPTAVSWLAAGTGVPTYKIVRLLPWTSFGTGCEPFAPAMKCQPPKTANNWASAFDGVMHDILSHR